jgi:hypothetical protein
MKGSEVRSSKVFEWGCLALGAQAAIFPQCSIFPLIRATIRAKAIGHMMKTPVPTRGKAGVIKKTRICHSCELRLPLCLNQENHETETLINRRKNGSICRFGWRFCRIRQRAD